MTRKKISVYPNNRAPTTEGAADEIHKQVGQYLHNKGFSHNKDRLASFTYHDENGQVAGTVSNGWYEGKQDNAKTYRVVSDHNGNPFSLNGRQRIECADSYNHSYRTWFEMGSGSEKLWFPNVTGIGMKMGCYTYGYNYDQNPRILGIYGGYINHAYTENVFKYPFQSSGGVIQSGGAANYRYAEISTKLTNYIRDNDFKFNKLYFQLEIARTGSKSRQPYFEFDKITFLSNPRSRTSMFVVPTRLRNNMNRVSVQYT